MKSRGQVQDGPVETRLLNQGPLAGQTFDISLRMCGDPLCPCQEIFLLVKEQSAQSKPRSIPPVKAQFLLDLGARDLGHDKNPDPAALAFAKDFIASMGEDDWAWFDAWWMDCKETQMTVADLSTLKAAFPERVFADLSCLVGYDEIVTYSPGLGFKYDGKPWAAVDCYCLSPECACQSAFLVLVPMEGLGPEPGQPGSFVDGFYDYKSKEFQPETEVSSGPKAGALIASLQADRPNLESELELRHSRLRALLLAELLRRAQTQLQLPFRKGKSVGRNEPCPCGSGKKFKKCCGS